MKKSERAAIEARTEALARTAAVDEENVKLRLKVAELTSDIAMARREAAAEREARLGVEKRLVWVTKICAGVRPNGLGE